MSSPSTHQQSAFYTFDGIGHDVERERAKDRCYGLLKLDRNVWDYGNFVMSSSIAEWGGATLYIEPGIPLDDVPWAVGGAVVVSGRVKAMIEAMAPMQAQFLPIEVVRSGWRLEDLSEFVIDTPSASPIQFPPGHGYWIVNSLLEIECMDWQAASGSFSRIRVIQSLVPADAQLFRVRGRPSQLVCRQAFRREFFSNGFKGGQFGAISHVG